MLATLFTAVGLVVGFVVRHKLQLRALAAAAADLGPDALATYEAIRARAAKGPGK